MPKLSTEQRNNLLVQNQQNIKRAIRARLSKKFPKILLESLKNKDSAIDHANSFALEASSGFDSDKCRPENFAKYVAHICVFRLMDQIRHLNKHNITNTKSLHYNDSGGYLSIVDKKDRSHSSVEWEDSKAALKKYLEANMNKDDKARIIIEKRLIPMAEGQEFLSYNELAEIMNTSYPNVVAISSSNKVKSIVKRFFLV